ncbi:MAG: D-alanyl-D-alanine carboxypeptidase/D-alanyl-D-alanine-endopeptidase [Propioniciclava sp.]|uniref:D-alanyl-D-alanine carboxypeptidase/D-alanyl-D-alanine endopeptidase n=1 Tax=Propioniciclava sp. TaxID=2038686 RepID=UPI0039E5FF9C
MRARCPAPAVLVWLGVLVTVAGIVLLQVVVRPQLADDPRVGAGRLDAPGVAATPAPVLPALAAPATPVDAAALAGRLDAVPRDGLGDVVALVVDASTGAEVYRSGAGPRTPASSLKVLTGLVSIDVLGPTRRFATSVILDGGTLTLVGGGDPLLASVPSDRSPGRANLRDLARSTADALAGRGVSTIALRYDATLFEGPGWNPAWPDAFAYSVAPITALTVDHARVGPGQAAFERHPDPARFAAERFAGELTAAGITVSGIEPGRAPDAPDATPMPSATPTTAPNGPGEAGPVRIAKVESLPVSGLVERMLAESDNDSAETLLWQVALARGLPATPASGAQALRAELTRLGLWTEAMAVADGNGISTSNQVSADALVGAVRRSLDEPGLRALTQGLPVAGVTGTLHERFTAADAAAGRGVVRAKTGTIRGVNTLAGYVVTDHGQRLVFAFMTSGGTQSSARAWIDRASSALVAA